MFFFFCYLAISMIIDGGNLEIIGFVIKSCNVVCRLSDLRTVTYLSSLSTCCVRNYTIQNDYEIFMHRIKTASIIMLSIFCVGQNLLCDAWKGNVFITLCTDFDDFYVFISICLNFAIETFL